MVDIRELNDRSNNALKIIGDAFYAGIYRAVSVRLGIENWQQQIESKLNSVEIYRSATDQPQHSRSEFLEFIIILFLNHDRNYSWTGGTNALDTFGASGIPKFELYRKVIQS